MRSLDDHRGIGFLFSLAMLPLAACPSDDGDATASDDSSGGDDADDDDDDDDDDDSMSASMTDPDSDDSGSSGPSTVTDPTTDTGPDDTSTGPQPESSTGPEPTTDDSGSTTASEDESTTMAISVSESESETESESDTEVGTTGVEPLCPADVDIPDTCTQYSDLVIECYPDYARYPLDVYCACNLLYYAPLYGGDDCVTAFEEYYACIGGSSCGELATDCSDEGDALEAACGG